MHAQLQYLFLAVHLHGEKISPTRNRLFQHNMILEGKEFKNTKYVLSVLVFTNILQRCCNSVLVFRNMLYCCCNPVLAFTNIFKRDIVILYWSFTNIFKRDVLILYWYSQTSLRDVVILYWHSQTSTMMCCC